MWERTPIPTTRAQLLKVLREKGHLNDDASGKGQLCVEELKEMFRVHVQGKPCEEDPTRGISQLCKADLAKRMKEHGLDIPWDICRGGMMACLRNHWLEQCRLAASTGADGADGDAHEQAGVDQAGDQNTWEVVGDDAKMKMLRLMEAYGHAQETMTSITKSLLIDILWDTHPALRTHVSEVAANQERFFASMQHLLDAAWADLEKEQ